MDEASDEELEYLIADLIVFYKGSNSFDEYLNMPLTKIYRLNEYANRINNEITKKTNEQRTR
jgi:hypothetical protein